MLMLKSDPGVEGVSDLADRSPARYLQTPEQMQCALQGQTKDREGQSCDGRRSNIPSVGLWQYRLWKTCLYGMVASPAEHPVCAAETMDGSLVLIKY